MHILMITPTPPWPLNRGSKIRIYHTLRELSHAGHKISLMSLNHEPEAINNLKALKPYCSEIEVVPVQNRSRVKAACKALIYQQPYRVAKLDSPIFRKRLSAIDFETYDIIWVHFLETLAYLPELQTKKNKPLIVLDQHNADEQFWLTYTRQGALWVRLFAFYNLLMLRGFQRIVLREVDVILSVSEEDAEFTCTRMTNPSTKLLVVPNGVDIEQLSGKEGKACKNIVIFCGSMNVLMNVDAVKWFANKIFPNVREKIPDAEFWIVGQKPESSVRALSSLPGIRVTGQVKDIRPYYEKAKVAVAPFRYGGGTKLKVLESMAMGVPVVATPVGCQGIEAVPDLHLYVAKTEEDFALKTIRLFENGEAYNRLVTAGRVLVENKYSWHQVLKGAFQRLNLLY